MNCTIYIKVSHCGISLTKCQEGLHPFSSPCEKGTVCTARLYYLALLSKGSKPTEGLFPSILLQRYMDCIPDNPPSATLTPPWELIKLCILYLALLFCSISFCFLSVLQFLQFQRIPKGLLILCCQRGRDGKGKGDSPSLFCVFGSFCHSTKGTALLFLTEKA